MIEAINAYAYYIALKTHFFTKKYNAWTYKFKTNISSENFEGRNDKRFFYLMAKKPSLQHTSDLIDYFSTIFSEHGNIHVSEIMSKDDTYNSKMEIIKSFPINLKSEFEQIKYLNTEKKSLLVLNENDLSEKPLLFSYMLYNDIHIETVAFFNLLTQNKMYEQWDRCTDTYMKKMNLIIYKYSIYLNTKIDFVSCKKIIDALLD